MNRFLIILAKRSSLLAAGLILAVVISLVPSFDNPASWFSLSDQYVAAGLLALALTPIMISGGIDLSVGSATVFASVMIGFLWRDLGWPIGWALAGGILSGLAVGLVNSSLAAVGVWPLVATLATRELFRGMAQTLAGDSPVTRFPPGLSEFWRTRHLGLPVSFLAFVGIAILSYLVLHHSVLGRMIFALGDSEEAARFAGLPVKRIKLALYSWSGLVAGLCGTALVMHYGAAKPDAAKALDLTAIACAVMGGVRITGGEGHITGTLLGIVTLVVLQVGMTAAAPAWRDTITGLVLIIVATVNEASQRWAARREAELGL